MSRMRAKSIEPAKSPREPRPSPDPYLRNHRLPYVDGLRGLIHEPLIRRGYAVLHALNLPDTAALLLFELVVIPLLIGLGWLFYHAVEARFLAPATPSIRPRVARA